MVLPGQPFCPTVLEGVCSSPNSISFYCPKHFSHCCTGSILKNQEDTFAAELHRLKQQPLFSLVDFESVVDWIRSTVAEVRILGRIATVQAEELFSFVNDWEKKGAFMFLWGSELHVTPASNDKRTLTNATRFHRGKKGIFMVFFFSLETTLELFIMLLHIRWCLAGQILCFGNF